MYQALHSYIETLLHNSEYLLNHQRLISLITGCLVRFEVVEFLANRDFSWSVEHLRVVLTWRCNVKATQSVLIMRFLCVYVKYRTNPGFGPVWSRSNVVWLSLSVSCPTISGRTRPVLYTINDITFIYAPYTYMFFTHPDFGQVWSHSNVVLW